ncbi:hypothetical protein [Streptomyces bottropensis]
MKRSLARLRALIAHAGQCSICQGWFDDWPGGICSACQSNGH